MEQLKRWQAETILTRHRDPVSRLALLVVIAAVGLALAPLIAGAATMLSSAEDPAVRSAERSWDRARLRGNLGPNAAAPRGTIPPSRSGAIIDVHPDHTGWEVGSL